MPPFASSRCLTMPLLAIGGEKANAQILGEPQLTQAVSKPIPDKKRPELAKTEARGNGEDTGTVKAFS